MKKKITVGILAHVDAGKTTLSEAMLYLSGSIRRLGRVDNQDAFLDTFALERERGITIFSKQAMMNIEDMELTLLDTPGHVDFSAEMERTLQVLDLAVLVISGSDGVQGHTETLWKLLKRYQVPVFIFVNKMDQPGTDADSIMEELRYKLGDCCIEFARGEERSDHTEEFYENTAMCEEAVLEKYLETGKVEQDEISHMIKERKVVPCYFGSALKLSGVELLLQGLREYAPEPDRRSTFGAKVYKIGRDEQGNRLTYLKVTGGTLKVKDLLRSKQSEDAEDYWEEKVNQIRIYSGAKFETAGEVESGTICAVTGLTKTFPGEGLGTQCDSELPLLEPVLNYQIQFLSEVNIHEALLKFKQLEEEEPLLHVIWDEHLSEIHVQLMGEVQTEILKRIIYERYGMIVEFGAGNIVYKETIAQPVEGVGHFEPLRHYAEVHLRMEPGEQGSGLEFAAEVSEDRLDRNWQRLILTHLEEKDHKGVLTGSSITDMRITLVDGRAHLKHTEGGDFRQATYRAVRQGLKKAESILLEPYYAFKLEVPSEYIGRAMSDIQRMKGTFDQPELEREMSILQGTAPVVEMQDYQTEVIAYTKGRGHLNCILDGYRPCHNADEVLGQTTYDSESDLDNPTGSVFCAHGAGFVVPWYQVEDYMHLGNIKEEREEETEEVYTSAVVRRESRYMDLTQEDLKELDAMVAASRRKAEQAQTRKKYSYSSSKKKTEYPTDLPRTYSSGSMKKKEKEYLLVDGYNIIFAWDELNALAQENIHAARGKLMDILSEYQKLRKCELILVFDAYKVEGFCGEVERYHDLYVVYTKEAETADQYIEKTAHEMGRKYDVTVATSDGTEQVIIRGQGCALLSARDLEKEIKRVKKEMWDEYSQNIDHTRNYILQKAEEENLRSMIDED